MVWGLKRRKRLQTRGLSQILCTLTANLGERQGYDSPLRVTPFSNILSFRSYFLVLCTSCSLLSCVLYLSVCLLVIPSSLLVILAPELWYSLGFFCPFPFFVVPLSHLCPLRFLVLLACICAPYCPKRAVETLDLAQVDKATRQLAVPCSP